MMLGILDLGLAVLRQNSLDAAARQVARAAIVRGAMAPSQDAWGPASLVTVAAKSSEIASTARALLVTINPRHVQLQVDWPDGGNQPEQRVRVRINYRHQSMFPALYGSHLQLRSECVMKIAH